MFRSCPTCQATRCPDPAPPTVTLAPEALPPCGNIPDKVEPFGKLGGVADDKADTLTLPGATVTRLVMAMAKHIDRENALEKCARTRGMLPPDPTPPTTPAPVELTP